VIVVAANGGSDLIYANRSDSAFIGDLVDFISSLDYVSGIFTDPKFGPVNGALAIASPKRL
jgi:hypothetical protein